MFVSEWGLEKDTIMGFICIQCFMGNAWFLAVDLQYSRK